MKCWFCGGELIWNCDYSFDDYGYDGEGYLKKIYKNTCTSTFIVAFFTIAKI